MRLLALLPFAAVAAARPTWDLNPAKWAFESADALVGDEDRTQHTIWQQLQADDKYSKLVKILKFEKDTIKDLDKKGDGYAITFFAVNNDGLEHGHRHHRHHHPGHHSNNDLLMDILNADNGDDVAEMTLADVWSELEASPWLTSETLADDKDDDDDDKDDDDKGDKDKDGDKKRKKRWRKIVRRIVHAILQYHIVPDSHSAASLALNRTFATALHPHDGSADGQARRLRVERTLVPPGSLRVNFYAVVRSSSDAANGVLHELNHPLFPPASIFEGAFISSRWVSTSTSALQRVFLRHYVDYGYDHHHSKPGKPKFWGTPLATAFIPSNDAWNALPPRLHVFLFSKFGERALTKLLAYHYVPETLIHTEVVHHQKHKKKDEVAQTQGHWGSGDDEHRSFHREIEVHSGVPNETLKVVLDKKVISPIDAIITTITVNGVHVSGVDIPARNGAWHVLSRVLCPPHHHHHHPHDVNPEEHEDGEWAGWETWLPAWAEDF